MMLPFTSGLIKVGKFDAESAFLADRHYSRQTVGSPQFMPPGRTMVLRNTEGTVVFGWVWMYVRDDNQEGYNCTIFRNESTRLSSDIILEAERLAIECWGPNRMFTYVDPTQLRHPPSKYRKPKQVGRCFIKAGWKLRIKKDGKPHTSGSGLWLFVKPRKRKAVSLIESL